MNDVAAIGIGAIVIVFVALFISAFVQRRERSPRNRGSGGSVKPDSGAIDPSFYAIAPGIVGHTETNHDSCSSGGSDSGGGCSGVD